MNDQLLEYRIAFSWLKGINRAMAIELLTRVGDEKEFFSLSQRALSSAMGFNSKIFEDSYRVSLLEKSRAEVHFIQDHNIGALYFTDPKYPVRLADADDAPLMLFSLGNCDYNAGRMVAVVGTRHSTPYGIDFVNKLVEDLKKKMSEPVTIVSGLAFGIDAAAHKASLQNQVPTVGVLAHGLNTIYPAQHRSMAAEMVRGNGGLITEYPSSAPIHKGNFVARNRIVAALCDCLVVAESANKGGALISAGLASGYNRDVFALPGRTSDRYSAGCNKLISQNTAALITSADDLLTVMRWPVKDVVPTTPSLFAELSPDEQSVVDYLTANDSAQLNQLTIALNQSVGKLMSLLIDMEFKGLVLAYPGGKYRLA